VEANRELAISLPQESLKAFPDGMDHLMLGMLEKDPERRWDADRVIREVTRLQFEIRWAVR
jgi:hypothetical protein